MSEADDNARIVAQLHSLTHRSGIETSRLAKNLSIKVFPAEGSFRIGCYLTLIARFSLLA